MTRTFGRDDRLAVAIREGSIGEPAVKDFVRLHYLGRRPGVVVLVLVMEREGRPVGVAIFAEPPKQTSVRYGAKAWELARLYLVDEEPRNAESWLIGKAIRWIRRNRRGVGVLVSYADPSAGHSGVVYRASNWEADGRTDDERKSPRSDYVDPATGKVYSRRAHVPDGVAIVRRPRVSKHRYVYRLR